MKARHYQKLTILFVLFVAPAAPAQTTIEAAGPPVTVADVEFPTSVNFFVNSAAAIDEDGNVAVAYENAESGGDNTHIVKAFTPDGETARHESPPLSGSISETPGVTAVPGNLFIVARPLDPDEESDPGLTVDFLALKEDAPGSNSVSEKASITLHETSTLGRELRDALSDEGCESPEFKDPTLIKRLGGAARSGEYKVIVLCKSKNFEVRFKLRVEASLLFVLRNPAITGSFKDVVEDISVRQLTEDIGGSSSKNNLKNDLGPPASDLLSATGQRREAGVLAYLGQPMSSNASKSHRGSKVTLLELGEEPAVTSMLQIDDPSPLGFPDGTLATCGFPDRSHYWVVFVSQDSRAIAARVGDAVQDMVELGSSSGAVDVACGAWGNAVVSWADTSGGGARVHTAVLSPGGAMLDRFEQDSLGFAETPDADDFRVSNDINAAGEVVVAWTDGNAGDDDKIAFRRLKVDGHFRIDGTFSGSHFSPLFDGEGFIFDIVEIEGTPTLLVYYFTYQPDGSGEQAWMVGSAPIEDNRAMAEVVTGSGATFGADFDPEDVTRSPAGTVTATFLSCGAVKIETESERFGDLGYIAQRLANLPLEVDGQCGQGPDGTGQVDASRGGSMFTPSRDGEGFIFDIVEIDGTPTLLAYYFTFQPDGSGDPAWMVGSGPIEGDSATATMTIAEGATIGPDFDPADVERTEWGEIQVTWQTCENVLVEYDGLWGEGSFNVEPLTPPLIGATGLCAP